MKFDFCIGNPPYQGDTQNPHDRKPPVYDKFMDAAFTISNCVELITPARFLFNAGQTSKSWNEKMLNDEHIKVLYHEIDSSKVFPTTDIKGGIAITIRNIGKEYGAIKSFSAFPALNSIVKKVSSINVNGCNLDSLVSSRGMYRFSKQFYIEHPESRALVGKGTGNMIVSNVFDQIPQIFTKTKTDQHSYKILGRTKMGREYRYIRAAYVEDNPYINTYNVFVPKANGSGAIGEVLSTPLIGEPLIGEPLIGVTDTFISIGTFANKEDAYATFKYIKTKFARALLGVNKVTQDNPKSVWRLIPLQDFTSDSDIDWSQSIPDIDRQLYRKYNLSQEEIDFIETHVKEMQ